MAKLSPVNLSSTFNSFRVKFNRMIDSVGDISSLNTDDNTTVVAAINTLDSNQGTRTSLTTSDTTNVVAAINELDAELGTITSGAMGTTASTVSGAIAELDGRLDSINNTQLNTSALYVSGNAQIDGTLTVDGAVTFKAGSSGSVNLGDDNTDNVVFNADVNSNVVPNTNDAYDLGSTSKNWKNIYSNNLLIDSGTVANNFHVTGVLTSDTQVIADSAVIQSMFDSNLNDSNQIATKLANRSITNDKILNNTFTINGVTFNLGDSKFIDVFDSGSTIPLIKSTLKAVDATGILYDSARGEFSLSAIPNSSLANSTFSVNGNSASLGSNITIDTVDSAAIISLVRDSAVSVTDAGGDGSLTYNSGTGVFTYTGPSASEVRAHFSAGDGIDIASGVISVGTGEVTNAMLAGSIENAKLTNSSITINGSGVSLGGSVDIDAIDSARTLSLIGGSFDALPATITRTGTLTVEADNDIELNVTSVSGTISLKEAGTEYGYIHKNGPVLEIVNTSAVSDGIKISNFTSGDIEAYTASGDIIFRPGSDKVILQEGSLGTQAGYLDASFAVSGQVRLYTGTGSGTLNSTFDDADLTVQGDITSVSDERTKENIETIPEGLEIVDALRGVYYNKIGEAERKVGVIAQEVETVLPEVVRTDTEGMKSVDYGKMIGVLIEAIKDLKHEIDDLKRGL